MLIFEMNETWKLKIDDKHLLKFEKIYFSVKFATLAILKRGNITTLGC